MHDGRRQERLDEVQARTEQAGATQETNPLAREGHHRDQARTQGPTQVSTRTRPVTKYTPLDHLLGEIMLVITNYLCASPSQDM